MLPGEPLPPEQVVSLSTCPARDMVSICRCRGREKGGQEVQQQKIFLCCSLLGTHPDPVCSHLADSQYRDLGYPAEMLWSKG